MNARSAIWHSVMGGDPHSVKFYASVPVFSGFANIVDQDRYHPLPDDWLIGMADVADSTEAVQAKRYKAVNMAGAAAIVAVTNALQRHEFPFVFGGDGASFAVPPSEAGIVCDALAATATWVREELDLTLRTGLVPVAAVRAAPMSASRVLPRLTT